MTTRRIAGIAGLVYAASAAIENMGLLEAPTLASPVADVRALYEDRALELVTSLAGALELVAYCVFAVALFGLLREGERRDEASSFLALVGGVAGPVVAAAGLAATAVLVADGGAGLGDDAVATLFDLSLTARMLSGGFLALFMAGVGLSALRSRALPSWLAWYACAAALPLAIAPVAAFAADDAVQVAARIAFSLQALWILLTSFWLALADGTGWIAFVRRCAFLLLVLGAGLVGIALVLVPGATGEFFAWGLGPEPLAAFAGGVYVGSAAVYALALASKEHDAQGLVVGAVVLSVSVLVITLTHLDQFDFGRLQAWAWVVLFGGFSLVTSALLVLGRGAPSEPLVRRPPRGAGARGAHRRGRRAGRPRSRALGRSGRPHRCQPVRSSAARRPLRGLLDCSARRPGGLGRAPQPAGRRHALAGRTCRAPGGHAGRRR